MGIADILCVCDVLIEFVPLCHITFHMLLQPVDECIKVTRRMQGVAGVRELKF